MQIRRSWGAFNTRISCSVSVNLSSKYRRLGGLRTLAVHLMLASVSVLHPVPSDLLMRLRVEFTDEDP